MKASSLIGECSKGREVKEDSGVILGSEKGLIWLPLTLNSSPVDWLHHEEDIFLNSTIIQFNRN